MGKIYLDNNATTAVHPRVLKVMSPYFTDMYANCSSSHCMGIQAKGALDTARKIVAQNLNVQPHTICFTSGATEANNIVIKSKASGNTVLYSQVEHASVVNPVKQFARRYVQIKVNRQGEVTVDTLLRAIYGNSDVSLICVMMANNEIGTIMDIGKLVKAARQHAPGVHFHCDATQYAGRWPVDVRSIGVDSLSMSAHKFHGPRGVGVLYTRRPLTSSTFGGGQERGLRPGTENLPAIVGLATAMEMNVSNTYEANLEWIRQSELRDSLRAAILHYFPTAQVNGAGAPLLPNTLNVSIPGLNSRAVLNDFLCPNGVIVNAGSACSQGRRSAVLEAIGVPLKYERGTLRFALSVQTTKADIRRASVVIRDMALKYALK